MASKISMVATSIWESTHHKYDYFYHIWYLNFGLQIRCETQFEKIFKLQTIFTNSISNAPLIQYQINSNIFFFWILHIYSICKSRRNGFRWILQANERLIFPTFSLEAVPKFIIAFFILHCVVFLVYIELLFRLKKIRNKFGNFIF